MSLWSSLNSATSESESQAGISEFLSRDSATLGDVAIIVYFLIWKHHVKHINVCRGPMLQALLFCTVHQHRLPCSSTHKTGFRIPRAYAYAKLRHNIVLLICRIVVIGAPKLTRPGRRTVGQIHAAIVPTARYCIRVVPTIFYHTLRGVELLYVPLAHDVGFKG